MQMKPSEVLEQIRADAIEGSILFRKNGICANFEGYTDNKLGRLKDQMKLHGISYSDWPLFSGDYVFPVPGNKGAKPCGAYDRADNMWMPNSYYAKRRFKLLDWLIEQFQKVGE